MSFLKRALKGVDRMNLIVGDLDMIAKFESQRTEMVFKPSDIVQISRDVMDSLELKANEKSIKLKFANDYDDQIIMGSKYIEKEFKKKYKTFNC